MKRSRDSDRPCRMKPASPPCVPALPMFHVVASKLSSLTGSCVTTLSIPRLLISFSLWWGLRSEPLARGALGFPMLRLAPRAPGNGALGGRPAVAAPFTAQYREFDVHGVSLPQCKGMVKRF